MAGWLSSKLREAENFLQQIDQQAAESLGKPEKHQSNAINKIFEEQQEKHSMGFDLSSNNKGLASAFQPVQAGLSKIHKSDENKKGLKTHKGSETRTSMKKEPLGVRTTSVGDTPSNPPRDDWTELLASPSASMFSSLISSSVDSSDSMPTNGRNREHSFHTSQKKPALLNQRQQKPLPKSTIKVGIVVDQNIDAGQDLECRLGVNNRSVEVLDQVGASHLPTPGTFFGDKHFSQAGDALSAKRSVAHKYKDVTVDHKGVFIKKSIKEYNCPDVSCHDNTVGVDNDHMHHGDQHFAQEAPNSSDVRSFNFGSALSGSESDSQLEEPRVTKNELQPFFGELPMENKKCTSEIDARINGSQIGHTEDSCASLRQVNEVQVEGKCFESSNGPSDPRHKSEQVESVESDNRSFSSKNILGVPIPSKSDTDNFGSGSETQTDSGESEDEEIERRKLAHKRRIAKHKEVVAFRAAAAEAVIKQREELVEKLEKEKALLESILVEQEQQQGKEAAELRLSTNEVLQALEKEKKAHSLTRMEALAKDSHLENKNAGLAKALGALQWELEEQIAEGMKTRNKVESKEGVIGDLRRKIAKLQTELSQQSKEAEVLGENTADVQTFEEEHATLWSKIQHCQIQAKEIELKISSLKESRSLLTETEMELESHLGQMTDQLIQKQAQVESLSSEKSTLLIRLEALSKAMQEETTKSSSSRASQTRAGNVMRRFEWSDFTDVQHGDVENGTFAHTAFVSSSCRLFSPTIHQLNVLYSAGILFLRQHRWLQAFGCVYIIGLHLWVLFVLFNHSAQPTHSLGVQELTLPTSNTSGGFARGAHASYFL